VPDEVKKVFVMAGGGTGGHVIPAIAVAKELRRRGHEAIFVGTRTGMEARLVPAEGFPIEWIEIGGLKRVGAARTLQTLKQLPVATLQMLRLMGRTRPAAVFSMGGYAAGPPVLAATVRGIPVVVMEPNAVPGFTNRRLRRFIARALLSFPETARFFPSGKWELTGLPVRQEFFRLSPKTQEGVLTVLITGGSRGSHTLNRVARESWPLFRQADFAVRFIHQAGSEAWQDLATELGQSGVEGEVVPFIADMPGAFARTDVVVCRSGAGAVAELAAAGRASILVPFPFAADDHQLRNAQAMVACGAARLVPDTEMTGQRLFQEIAALAAEPDEIERMGQAARRLARPGAAERAAQILEALSGKN
jgi:UDP-N-acetylglucosamine--N-acetylmuramyl-(pentapeptide) pyrophosphoryl-undecaprenol N-acetylglucosamine transferase